MQLIPSWKTFFSAVEGQAKLSLFCLRHYVMEAEFFFACLERLLRNKLIIMVRNTAGGRISNGSTIDNLYFRNHSARLFKHPTPLRPRLVTTALTESASDNFQQTAILLSHYVDILFESVFDLDLDP